MQRINLDTQTLGGASWLFHADYGAGKTHLLGDALAAEQENGTVLFVNVSGEDGYLTLRDFGLGDAAVTISNMKDIAALVKELRENPVRTIGVDSLKALSQLIMDNITGGERTPKIGKNDNEWSEIHHDFWNTLAKLRRSCEVFLAVCPSDKSVNQLRDEIWITPDLPGREATGVAGKFDFVGYMRATTLGPKNVRRTISFHPVPGVVTRFRLPKPITEDIKLPNGRGGWKAIQAAVEGCL